MSENKDVYGKAKKEMRLTERIVAALPGFRGYKEKELRRESDKLIRNHLYHRLVTARTYMKFVNQKLVADRRAFDVLTDADRLIAKFDRVAEKINHASYGYTGFFDVVKVEEDDLDRMIDFDSELVDDVEKLVSDVEAFKMEIMKQKFDKAKEHVQDLSGTIEALDEAFDKRQEVILG